MTSSTGPLLSVTYLNSLPESDSNKYELIEGELFVSRAPGIPHQLVLQNLLFAFLTYLQEHPIARVVSGAGAVFSEHDAVIPDLAIVMNQRWADVVANDRFELAPDLLVEIISPGSQNRERDFVAKRELYEKYGVAEYWIVDIESRSVLVLRLQDLFLSEIGSFAGHEEISSPLFPGFRINAASIFASLS